MISVADMKNNVWYNKFLEAEGKDSTKVTDDELQSLADKFEAFLIEKSSDPHIATPKDEERSLSPEVATRFCVVSNLEKPACPEGVDKDLYELAYNSAIRSLSISDKTVSNEELRAHIYDNLARIVTGQAAAIIAHHEGIGSEEKKPELDKLEDVYEKIAGAKNLDEALDLYYGGNKDKIRAIKKAISDQKLDDSVGALITLDETNRNEAWISKLEARNPNAKATVKDKTEKDVVLTIKNQAKKYKAQIDKIKNNKYMIAAAKMGLSVTASSLGMGKAYRIIKGANYIAQQAKKKNKTFVELLKDPEERKELFNSPTVISMLPGGRYINAANTVKKIFSVDNTKTFKKTGKIFTGKTPEERKEGWKSLGKSVLQIGGGIVAGYALATIGDDVLSTDDIPTDTPPTNDAPAGQWQEDTKQFWKHPTAEKEELPEGWSVKGEYANDEGSENQELSPEEQALQDDIARLPGKLNPGILTPGGLAELKGSMSPEEYKLSLAMLYPKEGCEQLGIEFKNSSQLMNMYNNGELSEDQKVALMRYAKSRWDNEGHPLTPDGNRDTASEELWKKEEDARNLAKEVAALRAKGGIPRVDSSKIDDLAAQQDKSGLNIKASQNYTPPTPDYVPGERAPLTPEEIAALRAQGPIENIDSSNLEDLAAQQDKSGLNIKASQNYTPSDSSNNTEVEDASGDKSTEETQVTDDKSSKEDTGHKEEEASQEQAENKTPHEMMRDGDEDLVNKLSTLELSDADELENNQVIIEKDKFGNAHIVGKDAEGHAFKLSILTKGGEIDGHYQDFVGRYEVISLDENHPQFGLLNTDPDKLDISEKHNAFRGQAFFKLEFTDDVLAKIDSGEYQVVQQINTAETQERLAEARAKLGLESKVEHNSSNTQCNTNSTQQPIKTIPTR